MEILQEKQRVTGAHTAVEGIIEIKKIKIPAHFDRSSCKSIGRCDALHGKLQLLACERGW